MKSLIMIFLLAISLNAYSQKQLLIDEIDNYMASFSADKVDNYVEQRDDEKHTIRVHRKGNKILWIEGEGSGEFVSFNYAFYFRNNKLIYSDYFQSTLKGHWSEFEDKEYEYHDREENIYYANDEPIKVSGSDSEIEKQKDAETDENSENDEDLNQDEDNSNPDFYNLIDCIEMAYELYKTYSK